MALDLDPAKPGVDRTCIATHPSLIRSEHRVDEVFGIANVPMAVWIDETGTLVRPAD